MSYRLFLTSRVFSHWARVNELPPVSYLKGSFTPSESGRDAACSWQAFHTQLGFEHKGRFFTLFSFGDVGVNWPQVREHTTLCEPNFVLSVEFLRNESIMRRNVFCTMWLSLLLCNLTDTVLLSNTIHADCVIVFCCSPRGLVSTLEVPHRWGTDAFTSIAQNVDPWRLGSQQPLPSLQKYNF